MKHISELERILSGFLNWNKARRVCFAKMRFAVRTVNLREIAVAMSGTLDLWSDQPGELRIIDDHFLRSMPC